jgi:hypothetical protein
MKMYGGVDILAPLLLTLALDGAEWSSSRMCRFTPGKRGPGTHWLSRLEAGQPLDALEHRYTDRAIAALFLPCLINI